MAKRIAISSLPQWAREAIAESSGNSASMYTSDKHTLNIAGKLATFDGMQVVADGEPLEVDGSDEIPFSQLPEWAQESLREADGNGIYQHTHRDGSTLSISNGVAFYNGQRINVAGMGMPLVYKVALVLLVGCLVALAILAMR